MSAPPSFLPAPLAGPKQSVSKNIGSHDRLIQLLVPFPRTWGVVVRASRSADSTSVGLSYVSAIAETLERNCRADPIVPVISLFLRPAQVARLGSSSNTRE